MVSKFEHDRKETRLIQRSWTDIQKGTQEVTLCPEDISWDSQRASKPIENTNGLLLIRFPAPVLDRLERGLALRQAWSEQQPKDAPTEWAAKLYANFEEWAIEQLMEYVERQLNQIKDEEAKAEEEALYPELKENTATPAPQPLIRRTSSPPQAGLNPHDPYRRCPWDR